MVWAGTICPQFCLSATDAERSEICLISISTVLFTQVISWVTVALTAYEPEVISQQREQTFSYCFSVR